MKLIESTNPILYTVSQEVSKEEISSLMPIFREMSILMREKRGCGLAANQVGILKRFFIFVNNGYETLVINPKIISHGNVIEEGKEGCLSFEGIGKIVKRYRVISVEYIDIEGKTIKQTLKGTAARIFQHELDHLDGKCIIEHQKLNLKDSRP